MDMKNYTIECDICHGEFTVMPDTLREETVTLMQDGKETVCILTLLRCPCCGKSYPVLLDDTETAEIAQELRVCLVRRMKYTAKHKRIPDKLQNKLARLTKKLDHERRQLSERMYGALYQFEGDTMQLDYRYRAQSKRGERR